MFGPTRLTNQQRAILAQRNGAGGPCETCECTEFRSGDPETACINCGHHVDEHDLD